MHTARRFTYFERCDLIAPLLEIILKWFIAVTESLPIQLVNKYYANAGANSSKFILQSLTTQISDSPQPKLLLSCVLDRGLPHWKCDSLIQIRLGHSCTLW